MYKTIKGKYVDGEVVIRHQNTMVVQTENERVLCFLQGEAGPKSLFSPFTLRPKKSKSERVSYPTRVIAPNGKTKDFPSIRRAASHVGVANNVAKNSYNTGKAVSRGIAKGYKFVPYLAGEKE